MNITSALALVPLTLFSGCATLSMTETGFLGSYSELEPAPERTVAFIPDEIDLYRDSEGHSIDSVWVAPIETHLASDSQAELSPEDVENLERAFGRYLREILGESFLIVDQPGEQTVTVRAAITDVDPSNVWVNVIGLILIVPVDMGGISGEIEVTDAQSGRCLLAMKACRGGSPFLVLECFRRWGHAYHGMKKWSRELRIMLQEMQPD